MKENNFKSPVYSIIPVPFEKIIPNTYNPNSVAPPEMKLLYDSIKEDGYTMPIVCYYSKKEDLYVIVDGFHRWRVMKEYNDIYEREKGMLPVSVIDKPLSSRMASTVRHNRARGSHNVDLMSNIVKELHELGRSDAWIAKHLGMDKDEILRLKQITGLAALFKDVKFGKAWVPVEKEISDDKAVQYKKLQSNDITVELFHSFIRRQAVVKCMRRENGAWVVREDPFIDDWTEDDYKFLVECLKNTADTDGLVMGAFCGGLLKGFVSVEPNFFGTVNQYLDLSSIHVSEDTRRMGIGKELFEAAKKWAKKKGAKKLYISAHPAVETQAFYRAMGCQDAEEYDDSHVENEPFDCQLECVL